MSDITQFQKQNPTFVLDKFHTVANSPMVLINVGPFSKSLLYLQRVNNTYQFSIISKFWKDAFNSIEIIDENVE